MNTVETRTRTTSTHPAIDARFAAAARLAREATLPHTATHACRAVVDALSTTALGYEGIALCLEDGHGRSTYQVVAGSWPPAPDVAASSIMRVPMLLDDARIGELTVYGSGTAPFDEADAALITAAAAHAALAVARAQLLEEVDRLRSGIPGPGVLRGPTVAVSARPASKRQSAERPTPRKRPRKKAAASRRVKKRAQQSGKRGTAKSARRSRARR